MLYCSAKMKPCRLFGLNGIWLRTTGMRDLAKSIHQTAADGTIASKTPGTHTILMQDLKYFVDIVESVHSGGASLFGLRKRKHSTHHLTACLLFTSWLQGSKHHANQQFELLFTLTIHKSISDKWSFSGWRMESMTFTSIHEKVKCTMWGIEESYAITQQRVSHHTFITPITLSAVSTGQLMERMAGWIAANCKSFLSLRIPQPLISTQL